MSLDDARVVPYSPRIVQTFKEAIVTFRADPDGKWIKREDHLSLLAEAEREIARLESSVFNVVTERNALQSRLDAVADNVARRKQEDQRESLRSEYRRGRASAFEAVLDELRAALGCATTGEGGE